jgi:hypothetical protein
VQAIQLRRSPDPLALLSHFEILDSIVTPAVCRPENRSNLDIFTG